jgi:hypothetical protein
MSNILKYRIWCNAEQKHVTTLLAADAPAPTTCPNDPGHAIEADSVTVVETYAETQIEGVVQILEEKPGKRTGGNFRAIGLDLTIPAGTPGEETNYDFNWPIPLSIMAAEIDIAPAWVGDNFCVEIAPDTVIGVNAVSAEIGDTVITVSDTVIAALANDPDNVDPALRYKIGYEIQVGANSCGQLVALDPVAKKITIETPIAIQSNPGNLVKLSVKMVQSVTFSAPVPKFIGESKIGGSLLPANTTFRIKYRNNDGVAKTVNITLEALY